MTTTSRLHFQLLPPLLLLLRSAVITVNADAMVTGTVFCDQCKDGSRSFFDYPLYGARVAVACGDVYKEETTNMLGYYAVRFEGSPDLSGCYARVVRGPEGCGAADGTAQGLTLMFSIFGMEAYTVDPLLAQPEQPMAFCPRAVRPPKTSPSSPVPLLPPPQVPVSQPPPLLPPRPPASSLRPPQSPPRTPAMPFMEASACSYHQWLMPEFRCYWRVVAPETPVAIVFGPVAARNYGPNMTLWDGLHGRGNLYRTLLREATTALLNSYNSFRFFYPTLSVVSDMNYALLGSRREALMTALRFRRANSGVSGHSTVSCNFTPCS